MIKKVKLNDIMQELEMQFDDWYSFLNTKTGEIVSVSSEELCRAEEDEDDDYDNNDGNDNVIKLFPTNEDEAIKLAEEIITEDYFIKLPTKFDVHEYSIMEDFCYSLEDARIREILCDCIRGRGAFGRFKDNICRYRIEDEWYVFKNNALKELAIDWCQENGIEYTE